MNPADATTPVPGAGQSARLPASPPLAVEACQIGKVYRTGFWMNQRVIPLDNVSLQVPAGETFGLLGPNGAGKTTLIKILLGIAQPSSGGGTVLGSPLGDRATKQRIGYLPENPYFYDRLTGWEYLEFAAAIYKIAPATARSRIAELLDWVQLDRETARKKPMRQYSKGMVQRVGMAQALIGDPDLVFLDEPMSGLDPLGRYQIREIILTLKEHGTTIFFNSHVLSDVERICDRVAILNRGKLLRSGTLDELLGRTDVYLASGRGGTADELGPWLQDLEIQYGRWHGRLAAEPAEFVAAIAAMGGTLERLERDRLSLEDFFVQQIRARG